MTATTRASRMFAALRNAVASDTAFIYALLDQDGNPRYVGCSVDPDSRLRQHWSNKHRPDRAKSNPALAEWLRALDGKPVYRVIAQVPYVDRYRWEKSCTEQLRDQGYRLFNIRVGTDGIIPDAATRARMSISHKARWTPELRARRSAAMTGLKRGPFRKKAVA